MIEIYDELRIKFSIFQLQFQSRLFGIHVFFAFFRK